MQKKLIALAIAAAMTVPALAYAEATVYGQARLSIDMVNDGQPTNAASVNQLNSNASRLGLKGSEDLGNGLSALWQMEGTIGMDTGTGGTSLFNRNTFLGLKSNDMGTVLLGRHDTPYKLSTRKLDLFADTAADNRSGDGSGSAGNGGLMSGHDLRLGNVIAYVSPDLSGFTVAAASVFGAENTVNAPTANKKGSALSLAGMYSMDNIYATLAYQTIKSGDTGTGDLAGTADDESKAFKLGGGYTMDQFTVNAVIEKTTDTPVGGTATTGTNFYIAGKFAVSGTDAVKLAYTKRGETTDTAPANQDGANQIAIGYDHSMSKATSVYALYAKTTGDTNYDAVGTLAGVSLGSDPSVLSFGVTHAF